MEMHEIRYFLAVSKTLNFTRAAEECNVAQPSLTRAIKKLEQELGGDLLRRERNNTHLTDLGNMMLPHLRQCYESAVSARHLATSYKKGDRALLNLALSHTIDLSLVIKPINEVVKNISGLEINLYRGTAPEVADNLKSGESELAIASSLSSDWERFDSWPLFTEEFRLVANKAHPAARKNTLSLEQLAEEKFLCRPFCEQADAGSEYLKKFNLSADPTHQVDTERDFISLLEANAGIGLLPKSTSIPDSICELSFEPGLTRTVYVHAVSGRARTMGSSCLLNLLRATVWPN